jgi:hypothetical protein
MVVELGALYSGDANRPNFSGTLFRFDVNSEGKSDCNMRVALESLRGGVVGNDGNALATNLPTSQKVTFAPACTVPNCVGQTRDWCIAQLNALAQGHTDTNAPGTGQALRQVLATVPAAGLTCTGTVDINAVSWPIWANPAPIYANWQNRGRPQCWAYPRQCRGDADGKKEGTFWVSNNDILVFRTAFNKLATAIPPGGICADFDHKKEGTFWVSNNDILIFRNYFNKLATSVPLCGNVVNPSSDPNYTYWCVPTGAVCPTGQYCAPVAVCPNSP